MDFAHPGTIPRYNPAVEQTFGVRTDQVPLDVGLSPRIGFTWTSRARRGQGTAGGASTLGGLSAEAIRSMSPDMVSSIVSMQRATTLPGVSVSGTFGAYRGTVNTSTIAELVESTGLPGTRVTLSCVGAAVPTSLDGLPYGKGEVRRRGRGVAILAFGTLLHPALSVAEALDASVANMRWAKPLDLDLLREMARGHQALVTVEEGCVMGGAGSAVLEALQAEGINMPVLQLGLSDVFTEHGDPARLMAAEGLDAAGIERSIRARFADVLGAGLKAAA